VRPVNNRIYENQIVTGAEKKMLSEFSFQCRQYSEDKMLFQSRQLLSSI